MKRLVILTTGLMAASIALSGCGSPSGATATVTVTSVQKVTVTAGVGTAPVSPAESHKATSSSSAGASTAPVSPAGSDKATSSSAPGPAAVKLVGNAKPKLGAGMPGAVSVVAQAAFDVSPMGDGSGSVPVIVRNDSDATVYDIKLTVTAKDKAGKLVGSGSDQGFKPAAVAPGQIAIGYAFFSGGGTDPQSTLEFDVEYSDEPSGYSLDLPVTSVDLVGSALVGEVMNPADKQVMGPSLSTACFDDSGALLSVNGFGSTEKDELPAGSKSAFTIDLFNGKCTSYLVAAVSSTF